MLSPKVARATREGSRTGIGALRVAEGCADTGQMQAAEDSLVPSPGERMRIDARRAGVCKGNKGSGSKARAGGCAGDMEGTL